MNADRLDRLGDYLITKVPEDQFNMGFWRGGRYQEDSDLLTGKCGSVACAVGWAATIPEFKAEGFRCYGAPVYDGESGWDAVQKFFDLTYFEACALFSSDNYRGDIAPRDVAHRIAEFLDDPEPVLAEAKEAARLNFSEAGLELDDE